jgi:membrane protein YdbS with pleckstrin-like domain
MGHRALEGTAVAYPDHLLSRGEQVVLHKHPHWKVLLLPVLFLLLIAAGVSFGFTWSYRGTGNWRVWWIALGALALILLVFLVVVPFVKWKTEHFVISTRHVFFRTGFFRRREHQIPLGRIQNLETNVTFWGRIFNFGTLTVDSAADQPLSFFNVAQLPKVQSELNQLIADDRAGDGMTDDSRLMDGMLPSRPRTMARPPSRPSDTRAYPTEDDPRQPPFRSQRGAGPDFRADDRRSRHTEADEQFEADPSLEGPTAPPVWGPPPRGPRPVDTWDEDPADDPNFGIPPDDTTTRRLPPLPDDRR